MQKTKEILIRNYAFAIVLMLLIVPVITSRSVAHAENGENCSNAELQTKQQCEEQGSVWTPDPSGGLVPCGKAGQPACDFGTLMDLINNVIKFILVKLAVPIAAVMFFYAGFKMVTSGGSAESKTQAKSIFTNTALGVAFVAGAWLIIRTVLFILGYEGAWIGF